jgi:hypothetical protein
LDAGATGRFLRLNKLLFGSRPIRQQEKNIFLSFSEQRRTASPWERPNDITEGLPFGAASVVAFAFVSV